MSKDPYVNYMQYNHYPTMGYNDIAEKMQDQGALDNANNYFKEQYPEMESMQAPPEWEKGKVGEMAATSALKGAGMGASIGSAVPVIGTAVGAGVVEGRGRRRHRWRGERRRRDREAAQRPPPQREGRLPRLP